MKKLVLVLIVIMLALPVYAGADMAASLNAELLKAPSQKHWQVNAKEVAQWIKQGKKDFQVIDVRMNPKEYKAAHIPGAIHIPYNQILIPENLKKLSKDKKIILACVTGQTQNVPVLALRVLGYDARTMSFGHAAWIKGYFGGNIMQGAIYKAGKNNYPLER